MSKNNKIKKYFISVCIIARPEENIDRCLYSLREQTYKNYEIVIHREIGKFSILRNKVIDKAKGRVIVFIDADCHAEKHWLEEINKIFRDSSVIGFFGRVCYELNGKFPSASTRIVSNDGQDTMTANSGFRAEIIKKVRFDEMFNFLEDIILNKNMQKEGKIIYSEDAIVFHQHQEWNFKKAILYARKVEDFLNANKKYGVPIERFGPIIYPKQFLIIFFPPLLLLFNSVRTLKDLDIVFASYIEKLYTRILIWKYAIRNSIFLI